MKTRTMCVALLLATATGATHAQNKSVQQQMEEARRAASTGGASAFVVRPRAGLGTDWPPGIYSFYNAPDA